MSELTTEQAAKKKDRSRAYPVMSLDEALKRLVNINNNLGINGAFNRETIAVGMGYSSLNGASARAVAAMVQYGLLAREKDQYRLSDIAKVYVLPTNDGDQERVIRESALRPSLFNELYTAFQGQILPKQFVNRLIHEFGIQQKVATDVERIFKATMEVAGFLAGNGMLKSTEISSVDSTPPNQQDSDTPKDMASTSTVTQVSAEFLSVKLPSGIVISYPQTLAPAFAFGVFGGVLKSFDDAITEYSNNTDSNTEVEEDV